MLLLKVVVLAAPDPTTWPNYSCKRVVIHCILGLKEMITLDILPTYHGTAPEYLGQYNVCSCVHMYVVGPEQVNLHMDICSRCWPWDMTHCLLFISSSSNEHLLAALFVVLVIHHDTPPSIYTPAASAVGKYE